LPASTQSSSGKTFETKPASNNSASAARPALQ
jgi:hypothetical protein